MGHPTCTLAQQPNVQLLCHVYLRLLRYLELQWLLWSYVGHRWVGDRACYASGCLWPCLGVLVGWAHSEL